MPFGPYEDFADCVAKNQDKENPEGYCAAIEKEISEGQGADHPDPKEGKASDVPMTAPARTKGRPKIGDDVVAFSRSGGVPIRVTSQASLRQDGEGLKTAPNGQPFDHRFIASTERLATDGGVILTSAWRLDAYLKRPRWIAMHDIMGYSGKLSDITLGKSVDIRVEEGLPVEQTGPTGRGLVTYVAYAPTPFAQEVKTLYEIGGLDDVSVRWDWRTEELRQPFEEEVSVLGDDLMWVATRADLIEISSVLFGADPGAQMIRTDLEAAFERCRAEGAALPMVEKFMTGLLPLHVPVVGLGGDGRSEATSGAPDGTSQDRQIEDEVEDEMDESADQVDASAVGDALDQLDNVMNAFDAWITAGQTIRDSLADTMTNIANLLQAADEDEERGRLVIETSAVREALEDILGPILSGQSREKDETTDTEETDEMTDEEREETKAEETDVEETEVETDETADAEEAEEEADADADVTDTDEEETEESTTDTEGDEEPFMDVEAVLADSQSGSQ